LKLKIYTKSENYGN